VAKTRRLGGRVPTRPLAILAPVLGFVVLWPATVPTAAPQAVAGDFVTQAGLSGVEVPPADPPPALPPVVTPPSASIGQAVLDALSAEELAQIKALLGLPGSSSGDDVLAALIKLSAPQSPGSAETLGLETLSFGSNGAEVALVQALFAANGIPTGPVDGIFGPLTEAAVRAFQEAHGLQVDGIVGRQTLAALFKTLS
jgi:peptidoglycan hydrolase-like protein with peptidoglycan-binding domain